MDASVVVTAQQPPPATLVPPPRDHGTSWWAWHIEGGRSHPTAVQPPSRRPIAIRWWWSCSRRRRPTSSTTTPGSAYAALWEGHGLGPDPAAPLVRVPNRAMFLFAGPVSATYAAHPVAWGLDDEGQEPDLVWPEDHAWCLACDVDEEVELTVGCSYAAAAALEEALPGHVRRVAYGSDVPLLRTDS